MAVADEVNPALSLGRLEGLLGFHLRMASAAMMRDFMAAMEPNGLTQKQAAVLELVAANPGVAQVALARALGTDRATMMALVDRLAARGLIAQQRSARDRRRHELVLTGRGEALLGDARRRIKAHERKFLRRFGEAELALLVEHLKRIHA